MPPGLRATRYNQMGDLVQIYSFLASLPAILGLAGFVLYHILGSNRSGDDISRRIVDKLRAVAAPTPELDKRLTPKQLAGLLERQRELKQRVDSQDYALLMRSLKQQFWTTLVVYVLGLGFCAWSVYLYVGTIAKPGTAPTPVSTTTTQNTTAPNSPNIISSGPGPVAVEYGSVEQTSKGGTKH